MILIKSPTRVDLSGGTLDMWPLYNFTKGAVTINIAIDIWTTVELTENKNSTEIEIYSFDYDKKWQFKSIDDLLEAYDKTIHLYQVVVRFFKKYLNSGFNMRTKSESPIGGGLGGSSSLTISMLKAFSEMTGYKFMDAHSMVRVAHNLEAEILNTPTGTQDYYPAVNGGLSFLEYSSDGIEQIKFDFRNTPLETHFLLINTGKSHHSGLNNFEVLKSAVNKEASVLQALKEIKHISEEMKKALLSQQWTEIPKLFNREYQARIRLTPAFTSPEIEFLAKLSLENGALAVKICGAGGGGCVLVWVAPENRQKVIQACEKEKFQCLNSKPVQLKN